MASIVMKMPPPRKRTPEIDAALFSASVKDVRKRLSEYSSISVKTWVLIGNELNGMQTRHHNQPGVFRAMFKAKGKEDETRYPFSHATGHCLIEIAGTFNGASSASSLPTEWTTLYELTKLGAGKIEEYIGSGAIHPLMTRAAARNLVSPPKPKPKRPEPLEDDGDVEYPAQVLTNALDSIKHAKAVAEAYRKIFKASSFDSEAKKQLYGEINLLIAKWRRVQSTIDQNAASTLPQDDRSEVPVDDSTQAAK